MSNTNVQKFKASELELKEKVVNIRRVTKVTKGGRTFTFSATVVVGNAQDDCERPRLAGSVTSAPRLAGATTSARVSRGQRQSFASRNSLRLEHPLVDGAVH